MHRTIHVSKTLGLLWALGLCLTGCAGDASSEDDELVASADQALSPQTANWYKGTLDQSFTEPQDRIAELDLVPVRATWVPVSKAWFGKQTYRVEAQQAGVHNFKATCVKLDTPLDGNVTLPPSSECDTGMLVQRTAAFDDGTRVSELFYSDNDTMTDNTNGGSHVDAPFDANVSGAAYTYQIVVFSRNRQSSHVNIWRATNMADWHSQFEGGGGTDTNGWNRYVGGQRLRRGAHAS